MKIFAGYDSGGTKTTCVIADEKGRILSCSTDGPSNSLSCGFKTAENSIKNCTRQALINAGLKGDEKIYSAFFGYAAIEVFSKNERIWSFLGNCTNSTYLGVNNDAYTVWYGTTFGESGIVSISGTGAVTVGIREDGKWSKSGGWGYLIEDDGSGYSIGRKAINFAVRSYDGVIAKNNFEKEIMEFFSLKSMREIISMIYKDPNRSSTIIASAAKCAFKLFNEGDLIAASIIDGAADEVARRIYTVYNNLGLKDQSIKIILSGGVINSGEKFINMIDEKLKAFNMNNYKLTTPEIPPELSALILAFKQSGQEEAVSRSKMAEQYKELIH